MTDIINEDVKYTSAWYRCIKFLLLCQRWHKNLNLQKISDFESNTVVTLEIIQNLRYFLRDGALLNYLTGEFGIVTPLI